MGSENFDYLTLLQRQTKEMSLLHQLKDEDKRDAVIARRHNSLRFTNDRMMNVAIEGAPVHTTLSNKTTEIDQIRNS